MSTAVTDRISAVWDGLDRRSRFGAAALVVLFISVVPFLTSDEFQAARGE